MTDWTTGTVKVSLIGFGMMGQALAQGMLRKCILKPGNLMAADLYVNFESLPWVAEHQVRTTRDNHEAVAFGDIVLFCIKPFLLDDVLRELKESDLDFSNKLIMSLVSGYSIERIRSFDLGTSRIVRIMPNTPALVGEAATGFSCSADCTKEDRALVSAMMSVLGGAWEIPEKRMNIWTAVAGAGPAYVLQFIEALKESAVAGGIPHNVAADMAIQTVLGSAKLARESPGIHLAQLRNNVCSPAGVSIQGLMGLQEGCFVGTVMKAVMKAKDRYDAVESDPNL